MEVKKDNAEVYYSAQYVMKREEEFFGMWVVRCRQSNQYIDRGDNRHDLAELHDISIH